MVRSTWYRSLVSRVKLSPVRNSAAVFFKISFNGRTCTTGFTATPAILTHGLRNFTRGQRRLGRNCTVISLIVTVTRYWRGWIKSIGRRNCYEMLGTVVSAYIPPGYKPTLASVPLKEFPDCFCYPLHSKVFLFSPTCYKHKPASVLRNCPPKHAKNLFVSRLQKIIC